MGTRNCGESWMPEAGAEGSTGQQRREKRLPLNPSYSHVYLAMLFSFEALQRKEQGQDGTETKC